VFAHGDEAVRAEQRLLVSLLVGRCPGLGTASRSARQLVDERDHRAGGPPAVEVGSDRDAGEGVHQYHVVRRGIQERADPRGPRYLLD
jgi:hypothetical protein